MDLSALDLTIYPLWYTPFWHLPIVIGSACFFIVCLIAIGIWYYVRRKKRTMLPPWQVALQHLTTLESSMHTDNPQEFYVALTKILKEYLAVRYAARMDDKTDAELIAFVQTITESASAQILDVLERLPEFKFAYGQPLHEQMHADLYKSMQFVQQTIPANPQSVR